VQLRDAAGEIEARGASLAVVGSGSPAQAKDFAKEHALHFALYVDPKLEAYRAAGLRRGVLDTLSPAAFTKAFRALRSGARQGATRGDPWQLGGAFVIAPGGKVGFRHVARDPGDHADVAKVLRALEKARA
jgi:peroxiredoxin